MRFFYLILLGLLIPIIYVMGADNVFHQLFGYSPLLITSYTIVLVFYFFLSLKKASYKEYVDEQINKAVEKMKIHEDQTRKNDEKRIQEIKAKDEEEKMKVRKKELTEELGTDHFEPFTDEEIEEYIKPFDDTFEAPPF